MTNRNTILNELQGLKSTLVSLEQRDIYTVPDGYFDGLADQVLLRIKAIGPITTDEELRLLAPVLNDISRKLPFTVPAGYFEALSEKMMQGICEHADYQTSREETASLSPLLGSISKKTPYHVPAGYFENITPGVAEKKGTRIISITHRKWYRYAAAAVVVGVIAISGFFLFNKGVDPSTNPKAWIEKNVSKKVSRDKIDEFVTMANEDASMKSDESEAVKTEEIKELMKDVSEKEIQDFLNDAVVLESNDAAEALLND